MDASELWLQDAFVVRYRAEEQPGLAMHADESEVSFNLLLSDTADFVGGGTGFRATATRPADGQAETMDVVRPTQGEMLSHCGQLYHTGVQVTGGTRYILAGFVGVESLATRWRELRRPQAGCGADAT